MNDKIFVIKAYYVPLETHLKILEKIKQYKIRIHLLDDYGLVILKEFENLPIQYRVDLEHKGFGYVNDDSDFYEVKYNIKKFIDYKTFLNPHILTMETE